MEGNNGGANDFATPWGILHTMQLWQRVVEVALFCIENLNFFCITKVTRVYCPTYCLQLLHSHCFWYVKRFRFERFMRIWGLMLLHCNLIVGGNLQNYTHSKSCWSLICIDPSRHIVWGGIASWHVCRMLEHGGCLERSKMPSWNEVTWTTMILGLFD
jgi:hypothetical protein